MKSRSDDLAQLEPWKLMDKLRKAGVVRAILHDTPDMSAREIGRMVGATRNSVIGLCNRQGINLGGNRTVDAAIPPSQRKKIARERQRQQAAITYKSATKASPWRAREEAAALMAETPETAKPLLDLSRHDCRMPVYMGRGRSMRADDLFCGAPVEPGKSWCSACAGRVFVRPDPINSGQNAK